MIEKIYEKERKNSIKLISLSDNQEIIYLETNIKKSRLVVESIHTNKKIFSKWIGFVAQFELENDEVIFLEYNGNLKVFDINRKVITYISVPNKKINCYKMTASFNKYEYIIYSSSEAYIVNIPKNEYKVLECVGQVNSINKITLESIIVINCPGQEIIVLDRNFHVISKTKEHTEKKLKLEKEIFLNLDNNLDFKNSYVLNCSNEIKCISFQQNKQSRDIQKIDCNYSDFKYFVIFRKSLGAAKYFYMLTAYSNCVYIFDAQTYLLIRRIKMNSFISDILIMDTQNIIVVVTTYKLVIFKFDSMFDFENYSKKIT